MSIVRINEDNKVTLDDFLVECHKESLDDHEIPEEEYVSRNWKW